MGRHRRLKVLRCDDRAPEHDLVRAEASPSRSARRAIALSRSWLLGRQASDGSWPQRAEFDGLPEVEVMLLLAFLHRESDKRFEPLAECLRRSRRAGGGWAYRHERTSDLDLTVRAYLALKLAGDSSEAPHMRQTREAIRALGGVAECDGQTRRYLALFGQIPHDAPSPVGAAFLESLDATPRDDSKRLLDVAHRLDLPFAVVDAVKPVRRIPAELGVAELFDGETPREHGVMAADSVDFGRPIEELRGVLLSTAQLDASLLDSAPPALVVWRWIAWKALGLPEENSEIPAYERRLDSLLNFEDADIARVKGGEESRTGTPLLVHSLATAGLDLDSPAMRSAVDWLLEHAGDADFGFGLGDSYGGNRLDTPTALLALHHRFAQSSEQRHRMPPTVKLYADEPSDNGVSLNIDDEADRIAQCAGMIEQGVEWLLDRSDPNGGWASVSIDFERDLLSRRRQSVGAAPGLHALRAKTETPRPWDRSPETTGRVLLALGTLGYRSDHHLISRAAEYLYQARRPEGYWPGVWGKGRIRATWLAVEGLIAVGVELDETIIQSACDWLVRTENGQGGWLDRSNAKQPRWSRTACPKRTAYALMTLISAGRETEPAVERGVRNLVRLQNGQGGWTSGAAEEASVPGFGGMRRPLDDVCYPLMALTRYVETAQFAGAGAMPVWNVLFPEDEPRAADAPRDWRTALG